MLPSRSRFLGSIVISLTLLSASPAARASFDFSPIISSLAPLGAGASASYTVQNTGAGKTPVQIYIVTRQPDIDGKEVYKEDPEIEKQFQIFPSQIILNPGEKRSVRVNWIGNPKPSRELSFRIISEELPIPLDEAGRGLKKPVASFDVSTKYVGSLYITPPGAKPDLRITGSPGPGGKLVLEIANQGNAHQVFKKGTLKFTSLASKAETVLTIDQIAGLTNQNVLAGKTRRITAPWPSQLPNGPVRVDAVLSQD